jgi:hypothetical protein
MRLLAPLAAGTVAFLVVAVAVTALLEEVIWPSVFVGVPVGVVAGAAVAVATGAYLGR